MNEPVNIKNIVIREYDKNGKTISNNKIHSININALTIDENSTVDNIQKDKVIDIELSQDLQDLITKNIKDLDKREFITNITKKMLCFMEDKNSVLFDDALKNLKPYVDELDLELLFIYWNKFKLFKYCKEENTIKKW